MDAAKCKCVYTHGHACVLVNVRTHDYEHTRLYLIPLSQISRFVDLGSNVVSLSKKTVKNFHTDGRADPLFVISGEMPNS